jgi:hypothetical protein
MCPPFSLTQRSEGNRAEFDKIDAMYNEGIASHDDIMAAEAHITAKVK